MDFNLISYLVVLIAIESAKGADPEEAVVCDPPWQLLHRSCVQFNKTKPFISWQEARDYCSANNADLFSINDKAEKGAIAMSTINAYQTLVKMTVNVSFNVKT